MSVYKNTSEIILDKLADGANFNELKEQGVTRSELLVAALFGVSELHEEYKELSKKYSNFKEYNIWENKSSLPN